MLSCIAPVPTATIMPPVTFCEPALSPRKTSGPPNALATSVGAERISKSLEPFDAFRFDVAGYVPVTCLTEMFEMVPLKSEVGMKLSAPVVVVYTDQEKAPLLIDGRSPPLLMEVVPPRETFREPAVIDPTVNLTR